MSGGIIGGPNGFDRNPANNALVTVAGAGWNQGTTGGGVRVSGATAVFNMMGAAGTTRTVQHNRAANGGGFMIRDNGLLDIIAAGTYPASLNNITNNQATAGNGGGIYVTLGGHVRTTAASTSVININNNSASASGGGIHVSGGTVNLNNIGRRNINDNTATAGTGGGINITGAPTFTLDGQTHTLPAVAPALTITGASVARNRAATGGGGIHVAITNTATATATIIGNHATAANSFGGGVRLTTGTFNMNGGIIGSIASAQATVAPLRNRANHGGGVSINGTGTFNLGNGVSIGNNFATTNMTAAHPPSDQWGDGGGVFLSGGGNFNVTSNAAMHIYRNRARYGGGIRTNGASSVNFGAGTSTTPRNISANHAYRMGGGVSLGNQGGTFTMGSITGTRSIQRNVAVLGGGGVHITEGAPATVTFNMGTTANAFIENNHLNAPANIVAGAGIHQMGGTITMNVGAIRDHNGPVTPSTDPIGPVASLQSAAGPESPGNGVTMTAGIFHMGGGHIHSNRATNATNIAGGVSVIPAGATAATFNMSGGRIGGTVANDNFDNFGVGGGVNVTGNSATFNMTGGNITFNESRVGGGGVVIANLTATGGRFNMGGAAATSVSNNTTPTAGGGFWVGNNGRLDLTNGAGTITINNNTAQHPVTSTGLGGGIHVGPAGRVESTAAGGIIQVNNNTAATNGGGIHQTGGEVHWGRGNIHGNNANGTGADHGGGGVFLSAGTFNMTAGLIGATTRAEPDLGNARNRGRHGGGVHIRGGQFNLDGGSIGGNVATSATTGIVSNGTGGGVFITAGNFYVGGTGTLASHIYNNRAEHGGGIRIEGTGIVRLGQGTRTGHRQIGRNVAHIAGNGLSTGGGVSMTGGRLYMGGNATSDITINGNYAARGAGVHMTAGNFDMGTNGNRRQITNNRLTAQAEANVPNLESGAGVFMSGGTFAIPTGQPAYPNVPIIMGNTGAGWGGGVSMTGGTFNMDGASRIRNHTVQSQGGGVRVYSGASFNMRHADAHIYNNRVVRTDAANVGGGGVFVHGTGTAANPNFLMTNGRIGGTSATANTNRGHMGGGVHISAGHFQMEGGNIQYNRATGNEAHGAASTGNGGGVFITGGTFNMGAGTIERTIRGNHALRGGGVAIAGGNFTMGSPGGLAPVPAAGMFLDEAWGDMYIGEAPQYYDYDHNDGFIGEAPSYIGIVPASGDVAQILNNTATTFGGGVYLAANVTFNMQSGTIAGNQAEYGGGMHAAVGTLNLSGTGTRRVHNNTAQEDGGGVWIDIPATITAQNTTFTNNTADGTYGMGGAIFTMKHQYENPLNLNGAFGAEAYDNIQILAGTTFSGNTAYYGYTPPLNAFDWTGIPGGSQSVHDHPLNNYDINFLSDDEPDPFDFEFIKTDDIINPQEGNRLEDAGFQLYWRPDSTSDWEAVGDPVFSDSDGVVALTLRAIGQHRLIEVTPPPGFTAPLGWWILHVEYDDGFRVYRIESYAGNPLFEQEPRDTWWVGNGFDFNLPLTGGAGTVLFTALGVAFVGFAAIMLVVTRKKGKKNASKHYY